MSACQVCGTPEAWAGKRVEMGLEKRGGVSLSACLTSIQPEGCSSMPVLGTNRSVFAGTARVELCAQGSADLAHLDDGPYEAGGEKEQDPRLIPVPANSYFGRDLSRPRATLTLCSSLLSSLSTLPPFCLRLCLSPVSVFLFLILISLASLPLLYSFSTSFLSFLPLCPALSPHSVAHPLDVPSLVSPPIPSPAGLLFVTNIDSSDPDQLVYKTLDPADRLPGPAGDLALNSYLGL